MAKRTKSKSLSLGERIRGIKRENLPTGLYGYPKPAQAPTSPSILSTQKGMELKGFFDQITRSMAKFKAESKDLTTVLGGVTNALKHTKDKTKKKNMMGVAAWGKLGTQYGKEISVLAGTLAEGRRKAFKGKASKDFEVPGAHFTKTAKILADVTKVAGGPDARIPGEFNRIFKIAYGLPGPTGHAAPLNVQKEYRANLDQRLKAVGPIAKTQAKIESQSPLAAFFRGGLVRDPKTGGVKRTRKPKELDKMLESMNSPKTRKAAKMVGMMAKGGGAAMGAAMGALKAILDVIVGLISQMNPFALLMQMLTDIFAVYGEILSVAFMPLIEELFNVMFSEEAMAFIQELSDAFMELAVAMIPLVPIFMEMLVLFLRIGMTLIPMVISTLPQLMMGLSVINMLFEVLLVIMKFLSPIIVIINNVLGHLFNLISWAVNGIGDLIRGFSNLITPFFEMLKRWGAWIKALFAGGDDSDIEIPGAAKQGIVQRSGLAKIHVGESVVRDHLLREVFNQTVNVENNFYGRMDEFQMMEYEDSKSQLYNRRLRR